MMIQTCCVWLLDSVKYFENYEVMKLQIWYISKITGQEYKVQLYQNDMTLLSDNLRFKRRFENNSFNCSLMKTQLSISIV